ncbi:uncharacterized protein [Clytia hemisphaerica]|uniref:uncharacterized protein isoform X3 n=1 Tax=Clytia hemisphaerica TaxID=252671 RepID=UPI0034D52788
MNGDGADMVKIYFWLIAIAAFIGIVSPQQICNQRKDIAIIYEVPSDSTGGKQISGLQEMFTSLLRNRELTQCNRFSLTIQSNKRVEYIQPFKCDTVNCRNNAQATYDDLAATFLPSRRAFQLDIPDIIRNADQIFNDAQSNSNEKVILLILTTKLDVSLQQAVLTSSGYKFMVVGINLGAHQEMEGLVDHPYRMLMVQSISELLPGKAGFKVISNLFKDINFNRFAPENLKGSDPGCEFIADVAFLIDASGSIREEYLAQLQFVQYVISSFGISKNTSHYGAIIFSDFGTQTSLELKFNEVFDLEEIARRVERLPYKGYRTRIDLAFDIANYQLFTPRGGDRPGVRKILFLLTDGAQNPTKETNGRALDPVSASKPLYDRGVDIFVIAVGDEATQVEMNKITRSNDRYLKVKSATDLLNKDFIQQITGDTCAKVIAAENRAKTTKSYCRGACKSARLFFLLKRLATTTTTTTSTTTTTTTTTTTPPTTTTTTTTPAPTTICPTPQPRCSGVKNCTQCCQPHETYINIFQSGSGPNYIMQGARMSSTHDKNFCCGVEVTSKKIQPSFDVNSLSDMNNMIKMLEQRIGDQQNLFNTLKSALASNNNNNAKSRKKRSLQDDAFGRLIKSVEVSGCKHFFQDALKIKHIRKSLEKQKKITLFCPLDGAYNDYLKTWEPETSDKKEQIYHHFTRQAKQRGLIFESFLKNDKLILKSTIENGQIVFKIEDANIKVCLAYGSVNICVIDKVLQPTTYTVMQILTDGKHLSIMNELFHKSPLQKLLHRNRFVNRVCFTDKICLPIVGKLRKHFNDLLKAKQYTIQLIEDDFFNKMNPMLMLSLRQNKEIREEFLLQHIFLGILQHNDQDNNSRLIAASAQQRQPVSEWLWSDGKPIVSKWGGSIFVVARQTRVKEGLIQVLRTLE